MQLATASHVPSSTSVVGDHGKVAEAFIKKVNEAHPAAANTLQVVNIQGNRGTGQDDSKMIKGIEGETVPMPPSSHESPSLFYDPLALLVNCSLVIY